MKLNQAVGLRVSELLAERNMTAYQLYKKTGLQKSTISYLINAKSNATSIKTIYDVCQGLDIKLEDFFHSQLFNTENLDS